MLKQGSTSTEMVFNLDEDQLLKMLVLENALGTALPEHRISPQLDDAAKFGVAISSKLSLFLKLAGRLEAGHIKDTVTPIILEYFEEPFIAAADSYKKYRRNQSRAKSKKNKSWTAQTTQAYQMMSHLIGYFNLLEHEISKSKNPQSCGIYLEIASMFEQLACTLDELNLTHTPLYEMSLAYVMKCQFCISDKLLVQSIQSKDAIETKEMTQHRRQLTLACLQNLDILEGVSSQENNRKRNDSYRAALYDLLVDTELKLGFVKLAAKRLAIRYDKYKNIPIVSACSVSKIINYIEILNGSNHAQQNLQQIILWSQRALVLLNKPLVNSGTVVEPVQIKKQRSILTWLIEEYTPLYHEQILKLLSTSSAAITFDIKDDNLQLKLLSRNEASRGLLKAIHQKLKPYPVEWTFKNGHLTIHNVLLIPTKKITQLIQEPLPLLAQKASLISEKNILKKEAKQAFERHQQALAAKRLEREKQTQKMAHEAMPTTSSPSKPKINEKIETEQPTLINSLSEQLGHLTLDPKQEPNAKEEQTAKNDIMAKHEAPPAAKAELKSVLASLEPEASTKSRWYSASKLKLKCQQLLDSGVRFLKMDNALKTYVGFMEPFPVGKGKPPTPELLERFRKTICDIPCKVGPVNQSGFKYLSLAGKSAPVLVGKIKSEPWRLLPICQEITETGDTVILYGKVKNTKKGKKNNRHH